MMRTFSRRLVLAVLVLGWTPSAFAQTADDVIEIYLAAIGGRAALGKLTSRTTTGTIMLSTPGGDVSGDDVGGEQWDAGRNLSGAQVLQPLVFDLKLVDERLAGCQLCKQSIGRGGGLRGVVEAGH